MLKKLKERLKLRKAVSLTVLVLGVLALVSQVPQLHRYFIREYVGSSVVKIYTARGGGGTGFHVQGASGSTYIMTNNHICLGASRAGRLKVINNKGMTSYHRVVKRSNKHDLCVIEALKGVRGLVLADNEMNGQRAYLIGHPALRPLTLSKGELIGYKNINIILGYNVPDKWCFGENLSTSKIKDPFLRMFFKANKIHYICRVSNLKSRMFNGIAYRGNSGSPVVNYLGNIIGVLFAGSPDQVTDIYLVPLEKVKEFLRDL